MNHARLALLLAASHLLPLASVASETGMPASTNTAGVASGASRSIMLTPMRLATLEWPPFVSASLPGQGFTAHVVTHIAKQAGMQTTIEYFPWARALHLGTADREYAGVFPAYHTREREQNCYMSKNIGHSILGFAYLKTVPFDWTTLHNLKAHRIGVVRGYSNGELFDKLAREGKIQTDSTPNDLLNVQKLLANRVSAIVIDQDVLQFLLQTKPALQPHKDSISFHPKPINKQSMHVCFQRSAQGLQLRTSFDSMLKKNDLQALKKTYFEKQGSTMQE